MTSAAPPYACLFDPAASDSSWWHSEPLGLHSFGHQEYFPLKAKRKAGTGDFVDTAGIEAARDGRRAPSFGYGTLVATLADAINVWVEGDGVARGDFERTWHKWWPHQLRGAWKGGDIEIEMGVSMIDGSHARIQVILRNHGKKDFSGTVVLAGDENRSNFSAHAWTRTTSRVALPAAGRVAVEKKFDWGYTIDIFPMHGALPEDNNDFYWVCGWYRLAFAAAGDGWKGQTITLEDGVDSWRMERAIKIPAGGETVLDIGFAGQWCGSTEPKAGTLVALTEKAAKALKADYDETTAAAKDRWTKILEKVPPLQRDWPDEWVRLYYKAWVVCYYNLVAPADMLMHTFEHPSILGNKLGHSFIYPPTWEQALVALLFTRTDPKLACDLIEGIYGGAEDDGFISEAIGCTRFSHLACVEPFVTWICYRASGDKAFLKRIWKNLRQNLKYRLYHANWRHLTAISCRNYSYAHLSARAALKIAREINRPAEEIEEVESWIEQSHRVVDAYWDRQNRYYRAFIDPNTQKFSDGTNAETLIPLFGICRDEYRPRLMELIREHFVTEDGLVPRQPHGIQFADTFAGSPNTQDFTLKESNWLYLYKAIKDEDRELFERILRGTVANICKANDFFEGYSLNGEGKHNGPGSLFGAFGVIWGLLTAEDQVDELLDEVK